MSTANGAALRALTAMEQRAVDLSRQGVPEYAITLQTRLSAEQIAVALARHEEWERLRAQTARNEAQREARAMRMRNETGPDLRPLTALAEQAPPAAHDEVPDTLPAAETEPEPAGRDATLPDTPNEGLAPAEPEPSAVDADCSSMSTAPVDPVEALLTRAEASPQPRARQLAAEVRGHLATLERLLGNDEKVRVLFAAAEVLRAQLATTEAELAQLIDDGSVPVPPAALEPSPTPAAPAPARDQLPYSTAVREWALANGWDVKPFGRLPGAVVAAYQAATVGAS